jgi:hypothetical protein
VKSVPAGWSNEVADVVVVPVPVVDVPDGVVVVVVPVPVVVPVVPLVPVVPVVPVPVLPVVPDVVPVPVEPVVVPPVEPELLLGVVEVVVVVGVAPVTPLDVPEPVVPVVPVVPSAMKYLLVLQWLEAQRLRDGPHSRGALHVPRRKPLGRVPLRSRNSNIGKSNQPDEALLYLIPFVAALAPRARAAAINAGLTARDQTERRVEDSSYKHGGRLHRH